MGVIKRHQSVAPVKYFKNFISFMAVRLSGYGGTSVVTVLKAYS